MPESNSPVFPIFMVGALAGTILTCTFVMKFRISTTELENINMSYADLITIMLASVTVVITTLAIFIAILAVWGYSQFERMTKRAAEEHVVKILESNKLNTKIAEIITSHVTEEIRQGTLRDLITERLDAILLKNAEDRSAEVRPANEEKFED